MKKFTPWQLIIALLFISNISFSQIISQYVETNSGIKPKGIEIWNNTLDVLDFTANNLVVKKGTNGNAPSDDYTLSSGALAPGEVIVIGTSDLEATTTGNGSAFFLKSFSFNGDDALEIWYGDNKTDVFGMPGVDPGSEWAGNGVSTKNQNIKLLSGITTGSLTGWTDPSTRFETECTDNCMTDFGIAPVSGGATVDAPTFTPPAGTYTTAQDIIITSATADASIYYTTDGTTPTTGSTLYEGPVHITSSTLFKAIAAVGTDESSVTTAAYVFPITVADIATLRTKPTDGTLYILTGEAFLTFQQSYHHQKFIQDATAGILIDDNSGNITTTYDIGDGITGIIGSLGAYQGMLQFKPVLDPGAATSTGNTITPVVLTVTEFVDNFETYEGMLVRVNGLTFDTGEEKADFTNGTVYNTSDAASNVLKFRTTFYNVDYIGEAIPTDVQDITGIANQRTGNYLTARFAADFDTEIVEAPVFTPPTGSYPSAQDVTITSATPGAEIFYTIDGSTPTDASTPYTGPINVASSITIKAIAYHDGMTESNVISATYYISSPPPVPLGSTGIIIAGLLLAAVVVIRKGRLF